MIWMLYLLSFACVAIPFAVAQRLGTIPLVSPLHILSYFSFFGVFQKTIYMHVFDGEMFFQRFSLPPSALMDGYLFITLFVMTICLGYVVSNRRIWRARSDIGWPEAIAAIRYPRLLVMMSFGVSAFVTLELLSARGFSGLGAAFTSEALNSLNSQKILRIEGVDGFGESNSALKQLLFLPSLTLALFIARYTLWRQRADLILMLALSGLEFYLAVLQGKRFALVGTFATFLIVPAILGVRFSAAVIGKVIAGVVIVFTIFVVMTTLRATKASDQGFVFDTEPAIRHVLGSTYFLDINVPILVMSLSPKDKRFYGASYFNWTFAWIPRAIWPEKPAVTLGPYVKQEVLGIYGSVGGINPTGPGEAFLNFGWFGGLVGLFLGWFYRTLETRLIACTRFARRYGIWIYATVAFSLISGTIQSSFAAALTAAAVKTIAIIILLNLVRRVVLFKPRRPA